MSLPTSMTAIAIKAPGGPEVLVPTQIAVPVPGDGEILVKVAAAGVNRPDVMQRKGLYPPPKGASETPGLEISGNIVALGNKITRWKLGDKVMALVIGGGSGAVFLRGQFRTLQAASMAGLRVPCRRSRLTPRSALRLSVTGSITPRFPNKSAPLCGPMLQTP